MTINILILFLLSCNNAKAKGTNGKARSSSADKKRVTQSAKQKKEEKKNTLNTLSTVKNPQKTPDKKAEDEEISASERAEQIISAIKDGTDISEYTEYINEEVASKLIKKNIFSLLEQQNKEVDYYKDFIKLLSSKIGGFLGLLDGEQLNKEVKSKLAKLLSNNMFLQEDASGLTLEEKKGARSKIESLINEGKKEEALELFYKVQSLEDIALESSLIDVIGRHGDLLLELKFSDEANMYIRQNYFKSWLQRSTENSDIIEKYIKALQQRGGEYAIQGEDSILASAIRQGNIEVIKRILDAPEFASAIKENFWQNRYLSLAIYTKNIESIRAIMSAANTSFSTGDGGYIDLSVLSQSSEEIWKEVVPYLIEKYLHIDNENVNILMHAIKNGSQELVNYLLANHPELTVLSDIFGNSSLFYAIKAKNIEVVKRILESEPELIDKKNKNGEFPLYLAISLEEQDIAMYLIEQGADLNLKTKNDPDLSRGIVTMYTGERTAIMAAIMISDKDIATNIVRAILNKNTYSLDIQDQQGQTALILASRLNKKEIAKLLIEKGADKTIEDKFDKTALDYAQSEEMQNLLSN